MMVIGIVCLAWWKMDEMKRRFYEFILFHLFAFQRKRNNSSLVLFSLTFQYSCLMCLLLWNVRKLQQIWSFVLTWVEKSKVNIKIVFCYSGVCTILVYPLSIFVHLKWSILFMNQENVNVHEIRKNWITLISLLLVIYVTPIFHPCDRKQVFSFSFSSFF